MVRCFSMRASLAAWTVTPAMTAPELSRTTPEIVLCANARDGRMARARNTTGVNTDDRAFIVQTP